ncbi:MAG: hypothetical protein IJV48_00615 [Ruminococcus sp.]|nr:hypothetical protein [Ruminococcus sp.]
MGLFGKQKTQQCETIEEFLQQEPSSVLERMAFSSIRIVYIDNEETENFYSSRVGYPISLKLTSYYSISDHCEAYDYKRIFTHKLPSKFKDFRRGTILPVSILEIIEQRGDDPNVAFFLGVNKEYGLMTGLHETSPGMADYHYQIAKEQGCHLLPLLDYLRTAPYDKSIFKERDEFVLSNLFFSTTPECPDTTTREITKHLNSDDCKMLRKLTTLGTIMCQEKGYPFSTLNTSNFIKKRVNMQQDTFFDNEIEIRGEYSNESLVALAAKVWLQAQAGDPHAIHACRINNTEF